MYQFTFLPAVLNMYSFLRNLQTVFQSGSPILHHHHQGMRILVDSHRYHHLVLSVLWMMAILRGILWYLLVFLFFVFLICRSLMVYVHSKGDQSWVFFGRNNAKAETRVLWPPHAKSWLIEKDSDDGRDWRQEEKGMTEDEMAGWHHRQYGHEF